MRRVGALRTAAQGFFALRWNRRPAFGMICTPPVLVVAVGRNFLYWPVASTSQNMAQRIQTIIFDLGDTLLDFGQVNTSRLFEQGGRLAYAYLQKLGQPVPSFAKFHQHQLWSIRWHYFLSRLTRKEFNSLELIAKLSKRMGQKFDDEQLEELAWLWYEPLSHCATVEDGLPEMLAEFRRAGLALGVISNTFIPGEVLDRHLARVNLLEHLSIRLYSCDVRYRKPNRNIFRLALDRGGWQPSQAIFVGDNLRADIMGANRAGMISVLKDPTGTATHPEIRPCHRIRSMAELPDILARYNTA